MPELVSPGFYLLRLPLLPLERATAPGRTAHTFAADIAASYESPILQEAVYLASPALYDEMMKWLGSADRADARHQKLVLALYRYLLRMSTRATPYGLFAGCAPGEITQAPSRLEVNTTRTMHRVTRLDMNYLSEIAAALVRIPEVRSQIRFFPNNSLYLNGESYRYFEYQQPDNKRRYFLSGFTCTPYIAAVMVAATNGAYLSQLVEVLRQQDIAEEEAANFLQVLIDNQILTAETDPAVTGGDYLSRMILLLQRCSQPPAVIKPLLAIQQLLEQQQHGVSRYQAIREMLQVHFPDINGKDFIQSDLFFTPQANQLNSATIQRLADQLEKLSILAQPAPGADLDTFKQQFVQKYDQREVPLMQALDSESGVGYGIVSGDNSSYTPLIDDLVIPGMPGAASIPWDHYHRLVLQKFLAAQRQDDTEIVITPEELDSLAAKRERPSMPPAFFLLGSLVATSSAAMDAGDFSFVLKSFAGPRALSLLGRFAASNAALAQQLQTYALQEQAQTPDRIIAEIVHLPEGRTGNVLLRPRLYDYEIPFLANASVDPEHQLPLSDLYVSVRDQRVILRSRRLGKEIIPRLTSAHNYAQGLPAYKFLCDLQQQQEARSLSWDWSFLSEQPFLPAVRYGNIVLSRARWLLDQKEYQALLDQLTPEAALLALWEKYNVPGYTLLSEGDNELPIEISNPYAQLLVLEKLKKGSVLLFANPFQADAKLVSGDEGAYANEVIIPFVNKAYVYKAAVPATPPAEALQRVFAPGSEWLYARIYCGPKWMDKLLTRELQPLLARLQQSGLVKQWFFVRFQDPDHHLRIRMMPSSQAATGVIIHRLQEHFHAYIENDVVKKLQYDTYIRETERYGEHTMELSEQFFCYDSEAVIQLLGLIPGSETSDRWLFALRGADDLLTAFGLQEEEKLALCRTLHTRFFKEFNGDDALLLQLNHKYRHHTRLIFAMLQHKPEMMFPSPQASAVFEQRILKLTDIRKQLETMMDKGIIHRSAHLDLLPHYLHMFMNRLFIANARLHELVIYHYLIRYYTSRVAMKHQNLKSN
ncbi:lantibiotic dehydratase [Chitinophaga vietnamensis]|uniref:lantibiotic dehydratase n=1 Tax=Chitinophaga vietnamensis TaxID=2593957 RepID=UPI001177C2C1|nr:lantibiotic dehydratase [Chitinophaga vietnamensis]